MYIYNACMFSYFRPDLIQYEKLQKSNAMHNLNNAFKVAEEKLGVTPLLDAEGKSGFIKMGANDHIWRRSWGSHLFLMLRVSLN